LRCSTTTARCGERPIPIQLDFILRRLIEMAESQQELRDRQRWKAAYERDYRRFGALMVERSAATEAVAVTTLG
jgi:hypothetical protein